MPSVFTRIIQEELPARFVLKEARCVAFLSNRPLRPGHTLVVPRDEVDHWLDLPRSVLDAMTSAARSIGRAQMRAFSPEKIGLMFAGLEVPHAHLHVVPIRGVHDLDFANADPSPRPEDMDEAAEQIRAGLRAQGIPDVAD